MLRTAGANHRVEAPRFTWVPSLGFRLAGYALPPQGVRYGFKILPCSHGGATTPSSPLGDGVLGGLGLTFVRLAAIDGHANSLA
jgi:hypothetical protein